MSRYSNKKSLSIEPTLTVTNVGNLPANADTGTLAWVTSLERFYLKKPDSIGWLPVIENSYYAGPAIYTLLKSPLNGLVDETGIITVSISTTNVPDGTSVDYTWSGNGLTQDDIKDGALTGTMVVNNGQSTISIELDEDTVTEGEETFTFTLAATDSLNNSTGSPSTSFTVQDSSLSPNIVFQNWDIDFLDFNTTAVDAVILDAGPTVYSGCTFSHDGNKLITMTVDGVVDIYNLDSPYQITTLGVSNQNRGFSITNAQDISFANNGTTMFILYQTGIRTYTLSTAYQLTTATLTSNTGFGTGSNEYSAMHIDGSNLYLVDNQPVPKVLTQFQLSTATNVTTASYVRGSNVGGDGVYGFQMSDDGTVMWVFAGNTIKNRYISPGYNISSGTSPLRNTLYSPGAKRPTVFNCAAADPKGRYFIMNFTDQNGDKWWFFTNTQYAGDVLLKFDSEATVGTNATSDANVVVAGFTNGATIGYNGQLSSSDGSSPFRIENTHIPGAITIKNSFELSFWAKINGNPGRGEFFINGNTLGSSSEFSTGSQTYFPGTGAFVINNYTFITPDNNWHHYTFRYSRTLNRELKMFRDGVLFATALSIQPLQPEILVNTLNFFNASDVDRKPWAIDDVSIKFAPEYDSTWEDNFTPPLKTSGASDIDLGADAPSTFAFTVTAPGSSNYVFTGTHRGSNNIISSSDPAITAQVGDTLVFNVSATGHPFYIKTQAGTGTGNTVPGVTNNGESNGTISWTPGDAGTYYYQCSIHSGMVGTITVQEADTFVPDYTVNVGSSGLTYNMNGMDRDGLKAGPHTSISFSYNEGDKVRFVVESSTASAHPFYIKTVSGGGTGNQATGVNGNGTTQVDWTVGTAGTYYYQCSIHGSMNNTITVTAVPQGQISFTTNGLYTWTVPNGVTEISAVAIGGGGGGSIGGGQGGSLAYNTFSVTPGETLSVLVGAGGVGVGQKDKGNYDINFPGYAGGHSGIYDSSTNWKLYATGGAGATDITGTNRQAYNTTSSAAGFSQAIANGQTHNIGGAGGIYSPDRNYTTLTASGGGAVNFRNGNINYSSSGGGAAGYDGPGGAGGRSPTNQTYSTLYENAGGSSTSGGGGGTTSTVSQFIYTGAGGGTGILGQGAGGSGGARWSTVTSGDIQEINGTGGSGGGIGYNIMYSSSIRAGDGGGYGGGAAGATEYFITWNGSNNNSQRGGGGAVRIIWGSNRSYPSTNTGDV